MVLRGTRPSLELPGLLEGMWREGLGRQPNCCPSSELTLNTLHHFRVSFSHLERRPGGMNTEGRWQGSNPSFRERHLRLGPTHTRQTQVTTYSAQCDKSNAGRWTFLRCHLAGPGDLRDKPIQPQPLQPRAVIGRMSLRERRVKVRAPRILGEGHRPKIIRDFLKEVTSRFGFS